MDNDDEDYERRVETMRKNIAQDPDRPVGPGPCQKCKKPTRRAEDEDGYYWTCSGHCGTWRNWNIDNAEVMNDEPVPETV